MSDENPIVLHLQVEWDGADTEDINKEAYRLRNELIELDVESVDQVTEGKVGPGQKAGDIVTFGALAVAVLPSFLPKIVDFLQDWTLRGQGRSVKFKGNFAGQEIEFEGRLQDLDQLISMMNAKLSAQNHNAK
jgi:hypothetical protein